jgi:two-component sensor histidine kinase
LVQLLQRETPASLASTDLAKHLRGIAQSVMVSFSFEGRVRLACDSQAVCFMPAHSALLAGLAVRELLINAIKFAHPSGVTGNLLVGCNQAGDSIVVDVADDGVGFPEGFDPMTNGELGLQFVRWLATQLDAGLAFHDTGIGVHVILRIPTCSNKELRH